MSERDDCVRQIGHDYGPLPPSVRVLAHAAIRHMQAIEAKVEAQRESLEQGIRKTLCRIAWSAAGIIVAVVGAMGALISWVLSTVEHLVRLGVLN